MRAMAFLADSVVVAEGKMYVQGAGWDTVQALQLPVRHSRLGIGCLIRVPYTETNTPHMLEIRIEDADGGEIPLADVPAGTKGAEGKMKRIGAQFTVGRPAIISAGDEQTLPIAANLDGLLFEKSGTYRVVVSIDGKDVELIPFRIHVAAQVGPLGR